MFGVWDLRGCAVYGVHGHFWAAIGESNYGKWGITPFFFSSCGEFVYADEKGKIVARYHMGWWPSRICVVLNLVIMLGYGMIDTVVGGQMLSAISGGRTSIVVGVIVVAVRERICSSLLGGGADFFFHLDSFLAPDGFRPPRPSCLREIWLDPSSCRFIHPHWMRGSILQHFRSIGRQQRDNHSKSTFCLRSLPVST